MGAGGGEAGETATGERPRIPLLPLVLALGMGAVDTQVVAPLLATIARDLGVTIGTAGLLVTGYAVASAACAPFAAPASARIGALRLISIGTWILFAGTLLCAVAPGYALLLAGRIVAGIGGGIAMTMCHAYVAQMVPYEERGRAVGWMGSGFFAATILGIPVGAFLAETMGWRWTFAALAAITLPVIPLLKTMPASPAGEPFRYRDYLPLVASPGVPPALLAFGIMLAGISAVTTYIGAWLELGFGLTPGQVGLVYMVGGFAALYGGPAGGKLADQVGKKRMAVVTNLVMAVFILLIPEVTSLPLAVLIIAGMHFTGSCRFPAMISMLGESVTPEKRGPLLLANHTAILFGVSAGSLFGSLLFESHGMALVALAGGLMNVVAAALVPVMRDPAPCAHIPEAEDASAW